MKGQNNRFGRLAFVVSLALSACSAAGERSESGPDADSADEGIVGGTPASAYPEAVLVELRKGGQTVAACSGALVAPRVVLTAGHCVHGFDSWSVEAPYVGATASAHHGVTKDYHAAGEEVDPSEHDLGLVFLDAPIALPSYPKLATAPAKQGARVRNIGRIHDGVLSNDALYVSKPLAIHRGDDYGYPLDYVATERIEAGDSGGPDMLVASGHHTIVAVNSGAGDGIEVLARVDLVSSWIAAAIADDGASSSCAHDPSTTGAKLAAGCAPCVHALCASDPYCCSTKWDSTCVAEADGCHD